LWSNCVRFSVPTAVWRLADLLPDDETNQTGKFGAKRPSDGYGTGFVVFALRNAGVPADDPALKRGIAWLKANQRGERSLVSAVRSSVDQAI